MSNSAILPLTVLGGFLGSGKTTLLNNVLRARHGLRILVMVNDFGSINVDSSLIESEDAASGVVNLSNGCVCCSIGDDLMLALSNAEAMAPNLDWMIIEGSGVSDPKKIAQIGQIGGNFQLRSIVTLVDASSILETADDKYVGDVVRQQLTSADILLLNKADLIDDERRLEIVQWLSKQAPDALVFVTRHAEIDYDILLNTFRANKAGSSGTADAASDFLSAAKAKRSHAQNYFQTFTIEQSSAYDKESLVHVLTQLPSAALRIKGFVSISGSENPYLLQYSPNKKYELSEFNKPPSEMLGKLVVIGFDNLDASAVRVLFDSAHSLH